MSLCSYIYSARASLVRSLQPDGSGPRGFVPTSFKGVSRQAAGFINIVGRFLEQTCLDGSSGSSGDLVERRGISGTLRREQISGGRQGQVVSGGANKSSEAE